MSQTPTRIISLGIDAAGHGADARSITPA